jgi:hypothetical protein
VQAGATSTRLPFNVTDIQLGIQKKNQIHHNIYLEILYTTISIKRPDEKAIHANHVAHPRTLHACFGTVIV